MSEYSSKPIERPGRARQPTAEQLSAGSSSTHRDGGWSTDVYSAPELESLRGAPPAYLGPTPDQAGSSRGSLDPARAGPSAGPFWHSPGSLDSGSNSHFVCGSSDEVGTPGSYGPSPPYYVTRHQELVAQGQATLSISSSQRPSDSSDVGVVNRSEARQPDEILWQFYRTRNKRPTYEERMALVEETGLQTEVIRTWCAPLHPDACGELDWVVLYFPRD